MYLQQYKWKAERKTMLNLQNLNPTESQANLDKMMNDQRRLTILVALMTLSFFFSWTPYATDSVLRVATYNSNKTFSLFAMVLTKTAVIINPILYIFFNKNVSIQYRNFFMIFNIKVSLFKT